MSITRWDPFRDMLSLREAMDQLLEQSFIRPGMMGGRGAQGGPQNLAIDVAEQDDAYEVKASLPGVRPEDVQVTVLGDTVTIRAETAAEDERRQGNYLLRERRRGVMQRTIGLPGPIEPDAVKADYENGVLMLRLPKSQASRPRPIEVRAGDGRSRQQLAGQQAGQREGEQQQMAAQQAGQTQGERQQAAGQQRRNR
jgi:HSP20 family protein